MSDAITQLSIKALLNGGVDYVIPMYQRNYAWDEGEITQLIQDIIDYLPAKGAAEQNYYIGTLVVFERKESKPPMFETIDGQQRLTTLSLLASYLKNTRAAGLSWYQELRIHFDSREHSRKTFSAIFDGNFDNDPSEVLGEKEINTAILNGYRLIGKILPQKLKESRRTVAEFTDYLFGRVQIMRVKVPDDTDLNHYFEIMNNRGEQLEKHEVLKSKMMEVLNGIPDEVERQQSQSCLHAVWEACANMERYVQMGFPPAQRSAIFGDKDWGRFDVADFEALRGALHNEGRDSSAQPIARTLIEIIGTAQGGIEKKEAEDEAPERFNTVINFANFLLHVLRVEREDDVPLDDKRLVSIFESEVLKQPDAIARVKRFIFALLRCKYLFDHYVIKREFIKGTDGWSLKILKWNDGGEKSRAGKPSYVNSFGDEDNTGLNRRILMLLSAFHVSTPTMVYKHWLNAALHHLFHTNGVIRPQAYLDYLKSVAKAFVFDRFVAPDADAKDYFEIIYTNKGVCQASQKSISDECLNNRLTFGHIENNLVFNFLDYLLWLQHGTSEPVKSYEFSFRSSVEHYYPQHPLPGHDRLPPEVLNSFGNLCLISHSKNSKLSNSMPQAKMEHYKVGTLDSVKQHLMMQTQRWDTIAISEHRNAMFDVLLKSLVSGTHCEDTQKE
jgi:hypothetical protein